MDWSKYLLDIIRSRVAKDTTMPIFMNADSQGNMQPLSNALILKNIDKYISELEKFSGNVCAIYHKFDEQLIGFIIAAFCCNVKILIRRTTMELNKEINDDIACLEKVLPIHLIYSNEGIDIKSNIETNELKDLGEFDFIQLSSGTTDASKAFCLSLEGLIKSAKHIEEVQHVDTKSVFLSYLTLSHIYGFVSGFLLPLVSGAKGLFCKTSYIKNDHNLLFSIIEGEKVTHTSVIMSTLISGIKDKSKDWNLSSLVCASLGGEKVDYDNFNSLLDGMSSMGMPMTALVNSYGMSEKGSISMEDPCIGNTIHIADGKTYISVGNDSYEDTNIIIFDDNLCKVSEDIEGMIGISSTYLSIGYYKDSTFYPLEYVAFNGKNYYCNGDKGFIHKSKVYVTGRIINTITFNGLKIPADSLNESISAILKKKLVDVERCYTFNYPKQINYVVCFIEYKGEISKDIQERLLEEVESIHHIKIKELWVSRYEGHGLNKISLPEIIKKYEAYLENR